jgi:hypothetical protein
MTAEEKSDELIGGPGGRAKDKRNKMPQEIGLAFPNTLIIQILDDELKKPISKIAVKLTIFASAKNDYPIAQPLSNLEGKIFLDQNWVRKAIDDTRNSFIMDYSSTMEQCRPDIRINVMSIDEIERAISAMKLFGNEKGNKAIAFTFSDLKNAHNKNYEPQEIYIKLNKQNEQSRELSIKLRRSKR